MKILLTNDDSHDSPLFLLAIEMLQDLGEVTIVVPAEEQSWKGKSMTRFGSLYVDHIDIHGYSAFSVTGTPADCTNLGIYNLMSERPDFVVSGINLGLNTGMGFALSSGTIGACFEANIAGIPALAISQHMAREDFVQWNAERSFSNESIERHREMTTKIFPKVWKDYVLDKDPDPVTWNVNLPMELKGEEIVRTRLGRTFYKQCFSERGDQYFHNLTGFTVDHEPDTDQFIVQQGKVSITRLDMADIGQNI
jgi:5'-nucleotidase